MSPIGDERPAIERALDAARARIQPRIAASDLAGAIARGALVVDIRPVELRRRDGELPGAVVIDRNVLEWRLDPTSPDRLVGMDDPARSLVIVCDEGYASSLAAAGLADLGLTQVTDLIGGYQAWLSVIGPSPHADPSRGATVGRNGRG